ncbi:MAG: DeoR/GlpR family DNA-binding transcription regulator [Erysipelotrichaceae bacterium]|nr:DeoR/GlpR family DNA-binding transcription regulator [Erysipelotrichaceae bacterium]
MLSKERLYRLTQMIQERQFVTINELMETFHVSRSSIVRDLIQLEQQGVLVRERGGATAKKISSMTLNRLTEVSVKQKEYQHAKEKERIGKQAAQCIKEGDCVYIDSGTTPLYVLPYLFQKKVTIVTPSIYVIRKLPDNFVGNVYLLGGYFEQKYDMSTGPITIDMIQKFNFDHAFLSTNGVDLQTQEVSVFEFEIGCIKKEVMKRSTHNYLLIDDSKLNQKAMYHWTTLKAFDTVFVNTFQTHAKIPDNFYLCE